MTHHRDEAAKAYGKRIVETDSPNGDPVNIAFDFSSGYDCAIQEMSQSVGFDVLFRVTDGEDKEYIEIEALQSSNAKLMLAEKRVKELETVAHFAWAAMYGVERFGYGVNTEKHMIISNTADVLTDARMRLETELKGVKS